MPPSPLKVLKAGDHATLAKLIEARYGIVPASEALQRLCKLVMTPAGKVVGGSPESPWSESTWLAWIKNRLDEAPVDPDAFDPASEYGPPFPVETDPTDLAAWRSFLERYSEMLLNEDDLELWVDIPDEARASGWMGFDPADEAAIRATEERLGRRLPPSLRAFYRVSNGWLAAGRFIHDVLPVEAIRWFSERDSVFYEMACEAEATPGSFDNDPGDVRLNEYRYDQGTQPKRCLVITSLGNNGDFWAMDPGPEPVVGEWACGGWSDGRPGWAWDAKNFAELMANELRKLRD